MTTEFTTFKTATQVKAVDSHTYQVELQNDWCIGSGKLRNASRQCCLSKNGQCPMEDMSQPASSK